MEKKHIGANDIRGWCRAVCKKTKDMLMAELWSKTRRRGRMDVSVATGEDGFSRMEH